MIKEKQIAGKKPISFLNFVIVKLWRVSKIHKVQFYYLLILMLYLLSGIILAYISGSSSISEYFFYFVIGNIAMGIFTMILAGFILMFILLAEELCMLYKDWQRNNKSIDL